MMSATVQTSRTTHPSSYSGRFSNAVRLGSPRGRFAWKRQSLHERPTPRVVSSTSVVRLAAQATSTESGSQLDVKEPNTRPLKVLIAGGGIGGLAAALSCRKQGMDVTVFEKVQEYKPFGGPIQLQCNALSALECVAPDVYAKVVEIGTVTGDRINGLLDGVSGNWYYRFDTRKPCHVHGLPLTTVVSRYDLLDFLREAVGPDLKTGSQIASYENTKDGVTAVLEDGTVVQGDILIGADGIRSKVRAQMRNEVNGPPLKYAGYAVYTAVCDYSGIHTDTSKIGYQVFLGEKQYFVSSDVGNGQQQYYAFLDVPPGGDDKWAACEDWDNYKDMLLDRFQVMDERTKHLGLRAAWSAWGGQLVVSEEHPCLAAQGWSPAVIERLECTRPEDVERRDVNDLAPDPRWLDGRVALLGDACHAVQPNLGQGGGQAIESAFVLGLELAKVESEGVEVGHALSQYCQKRFLRAGAIHGLSRMASLMNSGYRPYLGSEPYDFYPEPIKKMWKAVEKLRIPHPGRIVGQIAMMGTMDGVLDYVGYGLGLPQKLGGASTGNGEYRTPQCQVPGISAPKRSIEEKEFQMQGVPGIAK